MELTGLSLTNVRAFTQAEFEFKPGMNLLVGINGAGKSTVLDVLRIMLSHTLPDFTAATGSISIPYAIDDITVGKDALTADLEFEALGISFKHLVHLPREKYVENVTTKKEYQPAHHVDRRKRVKARREQDQAYDLVKHDDLTHNYSNSLKTLRRRKEQPLVIHFSTYRSWPIMKVAGKSEIAANQAAAYVRALDSDRNLHIRDFAQWWLVQEALSTEKPELTRYLKVLNETVSVFLENCTNLRAIREPEETLLIDKEEATLDVRQLSDGERSVLALVLDLAWRLAKVNPDLENPLTMGKAVVLIDELDLHLHPSWQLTIIEKLTRTFPSCQFIATTHSPLILGTVPPENITLIEGGKIYRPRKAFGRDSNWILEFLMNTPNRDISILRKLDAIDELIDTELYEQAQGKIDQLRLEIGEDEVLVMLQTRLERTQILGV